MATGYCMQSFWCCSLSRTFSRCSSHRLQHSGIVSICTL